MAVSEQLTKLADELTRLAARAQEAGNRATASRGKAKTDLEQDIDSARASSQAQADKLRTKAEESRGSISAWWTDVQKSWDAHVAELHDRVEDRPAYVGGDLADRGGWTRPAHGRTNRAPPRASAPGTTSRRDR